MNIKQVAGKLLFLFSVWAIPACAQVADVTPLFQEEKPLSIRLGFSFKEIKKNTNDSIYFPTLLYYKNEKNGWDSLAISIRGRGNFRRKNCYFTPIRIKIKKGHATHTLFEGNKNLKLVLPCLPAKNFNDLILKEYICYQLYEPATPYTFNTRLLDITLSDRSGKQVKTHQVRGFFIEDDNLIAKRFNGKVVDSLNLHPKSLHDTSSVRHDFFEYMIANTDWSTTFHHNAKLILVAPKKYIPVAYDFDMSGFVNAPYAETDSTLEITSVRQRVFRGFCRNEAVTQYVRTEYIQAKPVLLKVLDRYETDFTAKEFAGMKKYMLEFFDILESDKSFRENILQKCRTK